MTRVTVEDAKQEGVSLVEGANDLGLPVRLIGGVGIAVHDHGSVPDALERHFGDIDLVIGKKSGSQVSDFLMQMGYQANQRFNALHGAKRMLFYDVERKRQIDVFVGEFSMCHSIDLSPHLNWHKLSLAPEHLLMTKLQIVQLNTKDIVDVVRNILMHSNSSGHDGCEGINTQRVIEVTSSDWGWYTTMMDNFVKVKRNLNSLLDGEALSQTSEKLNSIVKKLEEAPKSTRWKSRAMIGRKKQWYELPEEIGGGH